MSNRLKLFSNMSGMQKRVSDIQEAKKSAGTQGYEMYRSSHIKTYEDLQTEYNNKKKAIQDRISGYETNTKIPDAVRKNKIKKLESELEALVFEYEGGTEKSGYFQGKLEKAKRKASGAEKHTRGRKAQETTEIIKNLNKSTNPLVVPVKTSDAGPGQLTFTDMLSIASRDIDISDEGSKDLIAYRDSVDGINKLINNCLKIFLRKTNRSNPIFSDKTVEKLFGIIRPDDITVGRIETNPDLIKLVWLYLNSEDTFNLAKQREPFIAALTKQETKNKKSITNPIETATSVEDLISSDAVRTVFSYLKQFIEKDRNAPANAKEYLKQRVETIINTPDAIYNGFSTSTSENIADTIYYNFISAFGSPEDQVLLLKRSGVVGENGLKGLQTSKFLSKEALDALNLKIKQLTNEKEGFKPLPSAGTQVKWGIGARNVNKTPEKYRGGKMLSVLGGKFLRSVNLTDLEKEEVDVIVGQVFEDISSSIQEKKPELEQKIKTLDEKVRTLSTPSADMISERANEILQHEFDNSGLSHTEATKKWRNILKATTDEDKAELSRLNQEASKELVFELSLAKSALSSAKEELASYVSGSKKDIKDLFLNQTSDSEFLSKLKDIFISRLSFISSDIKVQIGKLEKQSEKLKSLPTAERNKEGEFKTNKFDEEAKLLKNVLKSAEESVFAILETFNSLQTEDLEHLKMLFVASNVPEQEEKPTPNLRPLKLIINPLLEALKKYENQAPGTVEKDLTEINLEKKIKKIREAIEQVNKDLLTSEEDSDEVLQNELKGLTARFNEAQKELNDYREELNKMGVVVKTAGNKRLANVLSVRLQKLSDSMDPIALKSVLDKVPTDVFKYLDKSLYDKTINALNSILDTQQVEKSVEWKSRVRSALSTLSHYANSAQFKEDETRKKAMSLIAAPFVSELEDISNYSEPELAEGEDYNDEKVQKDRIDALKKHIQKLNLTNKPAASAKKLLRKKENLAKKALSHLSIQPGSALVGEAITVQEEALSDIFLNNAKNLDKNAKVFYTNILNFVKETNMSEQLTGKNNLFSSENQEFLDGIVRLLIQYKQKLSTDISASELENNLFLDNLINKDKISLEKGTPGEQKKALADEEQQRLEAEKEASLTPEEREALHVDRISKNQIADIAGNEVISGILNSDGFKMFVSNLNKAIEDKTIWYEKKIINAPIVAGLGLKSATLLNIMAGIKNFTSIEAFDLSLNRKNKNILSGLLDIANYPKLFTSHTSTSLMMKLFFLMRLKTAVEKADVINSFSGDFISVKVKVDQEDTTPIIESIIANVKNLNTIFEQSVLSELKTDFSPGGTLDSQIDDTFDLLWEVIEASGGNLYSINQSTGSIEEIPVSKESLENTVNEEGKNCVAIFSSGLIKKDPALENMLLLFDRSRENDLILQLKNAISIVKTGINFWVGYEALKAISEEQLYNKETKEFDSVEFNRRLKEFKGNGKYVAFVNPFKTEQDVLETTDETGKTSQIKLGTFTTSKTEEGTKGAVNNLNDNFLSAFTSEFIWETIKKPLKEIEKQELEKTNTDALIAADKDEVSKNETQKGKNQVLETKFPVFFGGIFKKLAGSSSESILDLYTPEAEKKVKRKLASDLKKAEKLLNTGENVSFSPINIVPHKNENGEESLGLVVDIKKGNGYLNVVGSTNKADSLGFGQALTTFSNSLEKVATILSRVYSTLPETVKEINEYSKSIKDSVPPATEAVRAILDSAHSEEAQALALGNLSKLPAIKAPTEGVEELTEPTKAYNAALKAFRDKNSPYYKIYEFAELAANDIDYKNITMSDIIEALNSILKDPSKLTGVSFPQNFDERSDSQLNSGELLTKEQIEKYSSLFFTRLFGKENEKEKKSQEQASFETIINILNTIKKSLGELKKDETLDSRQKELTKKIEDLKTQRTQKEENIATTKEKISVILTKLNSNTNEPIETPRIAPTNQATVGTLPPEEVSKNIGQEFTNVQGPMPNVLKTSVQQPEQKPEKEQVFPDPSWNWLTDPNKKKLKENNEIDLNQELQKNKQNIFNREQDILDIDNQIVEIEKLIAAHTEKKTNVAMVVYLASLYEKAIAAFNEVNEKIKKTSIEKIKASIYEFEFKPIKQGVSAVIAFIKQLKTSSGSDLADDILNKFESFETNYIKTFKIQKTELKESVSIKAVNAFKKLLEAAEEQEPIEEPSVEELGKPIFDKSTLTESDYLLKMAKYLKEKEYVNTVKDWKIPGKPGEVYDGVQTAVQLACMLHFIGETKGSVYSSAFKDLKTSLNSKLCFGFTVAPIIDDKTREPLYVQLTKLDIVSKVASNDKRTIVSILHPELLQE